jgi:ribosomal protein S18 acetylase RimI-like enzyme
MAALAGSAGQNGGVPQVVDLRTVAARALEPLLADEIREWRQELDWDFEPSAELVRQYAGTNSLGGAALIRDGEVEGYGYAVLEEPRGIIGDVYVRPQARTPRYEAELFRSLLSALFSTPRITRMESQLMLAGSETARMVRDESAAGNAPVRLFERRLMSRGGAVPLQSGNGATEDRFRLVRWDERYLQAASAIIAGAYRGETDSEINSQYRSQSGARRFLGNIVEFPGCGTFHPASSFLAFDRRTGQPAGMVLSSFVAIDAGHISQLCVMPEARGAGLGTELMRTSAGVLYQHGARLVSLTVTSSNHTAISIYEKSGFRSVRKFFAYVAETGVRPETAPRD